MCLQSQSENSATPNQEAVITSSRFTKYTAYQKRYESSWLQSILDDPDAYLAVGLSKQIYKHDRTTTVGLVGNNCLKLVIKRYNTKNLWHAIRRTIRPTRAQICWRFAHRLLALGVATAPPVAIIEQRFGPLRRRSYFISQHVEGILLIDFLRNSDEMDNIFADIKNIFSTMLTYGISHGDMKATNFVVSGGRILVLDLDAAKEHGSRATKKRAYWRDRSRFLKNWDSQPNIRQRLEKEIPIY